MKTILLTTITAGLMTTLPAFADEQRVKINVGEMTCPSCSFTVARSMRTVPTVEIVDFQEGAQFGEGVFVVTFDDETASADMIVDAVMANGYPARIAPGDNF